MLAANADLFLCEAGAVQPTEYHMTSRQSYELARSANVGRLLMTHIPHGQATDDQSDYDKIPVETVGVGDEWLITRNARSGT
jgi:ribonuclease BN (tRNA processing enzyme)